MASPLARILDANVRALAGERILSLELGPDERDLLGASHAFTTDLFTARALGVAAQPWLTPTDPFDVAVLAMPKERARLAMLLAMVRAAIAPEAIIAVVGHNKAGIKGAERVLADAAGEVRVVDARAHHRLLTARGTPRPAHLADWRSETDQAGLRIVSYPGVFSHGELDPGTALLLEALPDARGSTVLDAGCGSGVIGAWLGARGAAITATDVDAVAVEAARETLEANEVSGSAVLADLFVQGRFDLIVSNPPFHRGLRTTTATGERLITEAPDHLSAGGELWLVVNRHLGHMARVAASFADVGIVAEDGRYQVLRARKGKRTNA